MFTADMRRKEPRQVPRPGRDETSRDAVSQVVTEGEGGRVVAHGFAGMLALAARQRGIDPGAVIGDTGGDLS